MNEYILQVKNLKTWFKLDTGTLKAVDDVTFSLKRNETIGIIGESGCGKSVTAHSILRTVQNPGKVLGGEILYDDGNGPVDLVGYKPDSREMRKLRGRDLHDLSGAHGQSGSGLYDRRTDDGSGHGTSG